MQLDFTQPPSLALIQINALKGTQQLRAAADILDAVGDLSVPTHYVDAYLELASNILYSVHTRLIAATADTQRPEARSSQERVGCL